MFADPYAGFMALSTIALVLGVLAYGIGGAQLSTGSKDEGSPFASKNWWIGTICQGLGFLFTLAARQTLPLLIVQACIVGGLAVTAVIEHVTGRSRMRGRGWAAIGGMIAGIAMLAATTVPGPAPPTTGIHVLVVAALLGLCLGAFLVKLPPAVSGIFGGTGFALTAICARMIMADPTISLFQFWTWPWQTWAVAVLMVASLVAGQMHLTVGLGKADGVTVLSTNYLMSTLVPATFGVLLLGELPRPGTALLVSIGLAIALVSAFMLIRNNNPQAAE